MTGQVKFGLVKSDRSSQKKFGYKSFWAQFFDPTFLKTQYFFLTQHCFFDLKNLWTQKFVAPNFF